MEAKVVTLIEPIEAHGEKIAQLIIEQPVAKDMRNIPVGPLICGTLLDLAAKCSGVPPSSMDTLCAADVMQITEVMGDFFMRGPGENPSP